MLASLTRVRNAIAAVVGADELLLACALALVTVGLWPIIGRSALVVPGTVLLWIALPSRAPLVVRPPSPPETPARRTL